MKLFSKKTIKADLKEYSNQVTKLVNDYIVSHPNIMHEVILAANSLKNENELYFWMTETLERNTPDIRKVWLEAPGDDVVNWHELAYAWFNTINRNEALPGEFSIENLPILDKKKKLDELLDSLSKETDPTKQEQIKQHITRIKNAKLLKAKSRYGEEAICNYCGKWQPTDLTPQQLEEMDWKCDECKAKEPISQEVIPLEQDRGQKEISKFDPEYEFLTKLINVVVKAGVNPQDIKELTLQNPFVTVDDAGNLAAKIWTLATEKYQIPREWLIKKLPEKKITSDLWPAQEAASDFGNHEWNSLSYNPLQYRDTSVSGPRPDDVAKKSSPETDHALFMSMGEDIVQTYFFEKGIRWSQVVQFLKDQVPQLSDEDIVNLKTDTKYKLEQYKIQIESKKKGLSLDKVLQILESKGPKPTHVDYTNLTIEFTDGSKLSFDQATSKALELSKGASADSEEQERNKDSGTGFYDSPQGYQFGKRPQGDPSEWPSDTWMPRGTETEDQEPWDNIAASQKPFSRKAFLKISKPESGYVDNEKGYTCGRCAYFNQEENKCALVQGEIKAQGCCNYWDDKAQLKQEGPGYTKEEAAYIEFPNVDYRCDECVFFNPKSNTCTKVEGEISPTASCNLWQPINKKQSFSKKEINKYASDSDFWISPDGKEFPLMEYETHAAWMGKNKRISLNQAIDEGWIRVSVTPDHLYLSLKDINNVPDFLNDFIIKHTKKYVTVGWNQDTKVVYLDYEDIISNGIKKAINKAPKHKQSFSKKEINKIANPPSRFWIAPDGKEFSTGSAGHGAWIKLNKDLLNQYGVNISTVGYTWPDMLKKGWIRVSNEPSGTGFTIEVNNLKNIPSYLDNFIAKYFKDGDIITIGSQDNFIRVDNPFPTIQKAVNKALRNTVNAMLKIKADISGQVINEILKGIEANGGITYNISQGNLAGTDNYAVSIYPDREVITEGPVDFDRLENFIINNEDLLNDPKNSFGSWINNGKIYLDVIVTVPNKEEALRLAHQNNQLAIFDLKNMQEIPVGVPSFSKKELNIVKEAEEQILSQDQQDQIAASTSPVYNIALNNFASAVKRGHDKNRSLSYAVDSVKNLEKIDPKKLIELANNYLKGLV